MTNKKVCFLLGIKEKLVSNSIYSQLVPIKIPKTKLTGVNLKLVMEVI